MSHLVSFLFGAIALLARCLVDAQTTSAPPSSSVVNALTVTPIAAYVYPPLTVTGQFPCLTSNSYVILTDSQSSLATYPVWTCSSSCGTLSSGVGLMVFPATKTTGAYEVLHPPSGYPALGVTDLAVTTDTSFSTITSINIDGPSPSTTKSLTYPQFPGLTLTFVTTTSISAVMATPISVPVNCQGSAGPGGSISASPTPSPGPLVSSATYAPTFSASNTKGVAGESSPSYPASGLPASTASVPFTTGSASSASNGRGPNPESASQSVNVASDSNTVSAFGSSSLAGVGAQNSNTDTATALTSASITVSSNYAVISDPWSSSQSGAGTSNSDVGPNPTSISNSIGVPASGQSFNYAFSSQRAPSNSAIVLSSGTSTQVGASNASPATTSTAPGQAGGTASTSAQSSVSSESSSGSNQATQGTNTISQAPASSSASLSAPVSLSGQPLPPGATIITSTVTASGSAATIAETFIPTTYSTLIGLTSTLTTSSIISLGTSSTSAVPVTIYPGGVAWGIPGVGPGTPILPPPTVAPSPGSRLTSASLGLSSSTSQSSSSGFTTLLSPGGDSSDIPPSLTAEPAPLTNGPPSSILPLLKTFSGTTSPIIEEISTGVSSDGHTQATGGALPFPVFWGHSHFCFLFCPSHGGCLLCGFSINLKPGIYPPGSIDWPPGWTPPHVTITVDPDGTPTYDENEEQETSEPSNSANSQSSPSNTVSQTPSSASTAGSSTTITSSISSSVSSSVSSSAVTSGASQCAPSCAACATIVPPPSTGSDKVKRILQGADISILEKRILPLPSDDPYFGDVDAFILGQYVVKMRATVPLRKDTQHPSSALYYDLENQPFGVAVGGLFGCTSLIVMSTKGVWMSHFWENPSFNVPGQTAQQNQANFQNQVINVLGPGDGTSGFPGLNQYVGANGPFGPGTNAHAAILTPRNRGNPQPGVYMFDAMVRQLAGTVSQIFGGGTPAIYDYTPRSDEFSQQWSASGKVIFQYDPVQARCADPQNGVLTQYAAERLWIQDDPASTYYYWWTAWAGGANNPNQFVPYVTPPRRPKRRDPALKDEQSWVGLQKRQDPGSQPSVAPSCLAAIEATASGLTAGATAVPVGGTYGAFSASSFGTMPTQSTQSGSSASVTSAVSGLSQSTTSGSTRNSAASAASLAATSYAMVTAQPLCVPYENPEGGDGGVENCNALNLCECSTGTMTATYTTTSGTDQCGYTQLPSSTWDGQNICTMGVSASASSASALHPPSPVTSGQIIYTDTVLPISGAGTTVYGCTSTTTGPGIAGYESTGCVGSKTPLTTLFPPVVTPTGAPYPTPSCNKPCNPQDSSCNGDTTGYVPDPVFFEAAIGVFCGPNCQGKPGCLSATGLTLDAHDGAFYATFPCTTAQNSPGGNSSLDCEPKDWEHNPPPFWEASGINFNIAVKLIDKNCRWTVDAATCKSDLSNTLSGCPAAGVDWNECVAWTVGAGGSSLSLSAWEAQAVPTGSK